MAWRAAKVVSAAFSVAGYSRSTWAGGASSLISLMRTSSIGGVIGAFIFEFLTARAAEAVG